MIDDTTYMTIKLDTRYDTLELFTGYNEWEDHDEEKRKGLPRGLSYIIEETGKCKWPVFTFPEVNQPNYSFDDVKPFVAEICGRRWRITITTRWGSPPHYDGVPSGAEVVFEETVAELTPPFLKPTHGGDCSRWFGQPNFIQNTVIPHYKGESAFLLACIESGWGDSGNENIFVALNEQNEPVGIYHEYSCC